MTGPDPSWPLVSGVDGSAPSLRAVDRAADEAEPRGVPLRLVHAAPAGRYPGPAGDVAPSPPGGCTSAAPACGSTRRSCRTNRGTR
ncbi:universal stress protein [Streptomyces cellulosae]|uniref:universal stress protein n=1 Tax=Streptomyces thermocarboxydus TaxID=59299 RepID=UPI00321FA379